MLIWLLLSKEQLLLFWHHNDRAVTEYADKGKSKSPAYNTNNPSNILSKQVPDKVQKLKLASTKKHKKVEFEFQKLTGLPMNTEIDKKLLFGIFDIPSKKKHKEVEHMLIANYQKNHDHRSDSSFTTIVSQMDG